MKRDWSGCFALRTFDDETSLKEIAGEAGVSEAMVVKITKKLGFAGYREFRNAVAQYNRLPTAEMHQELSLEDTSRKIVQKVFRTSIQALEETLAIMDIEAFERAADLIYGARQRDFYGVGGSAQIARDVAHKFLRIGVRSSVYDDSHMMLMSAALLGPDDVAIGFSPESWPATILRPSLPRAVRVWLSCSPTATRRRFLRSRSSSSALMAPATSSSARWQLSSHVARRLSAR